MQCPKCGSENTHKRGVAGSGNPRIYCKDCGAHPTISDPDMIVRARSILYDADGKEKLVWEKTQLDNDKYKKRLQEAIDGLVTQVRPQKPTTGPKVVSDALCNLYTLTDVHVGMLAWHEEGGEDWDLKIAESTLMGCFTEMVGNSPKAKVGIVNQLGDFLHSDFTALNAVTPMSGHSLDSDGRASKIIQAAIRILRSIINLALKKHNKVHVIMAEGNHDMVSSIWLRQMFEALYEDEPRVTIDTTPLPYYAYQHGETMICCHHGHMKKMNSLVGMMAAQFPKMWGDTTKRYAHTGHYHHLKVQEDAGMTIMQHRTLAAKDAYSARGGYHSERSATAITYHVKHGQVGTTTVCPEMLDE